MRSAVDSHAAPPLLLVLDRTDGRRGGGRARGVAVFAACALERRANGRGRVKGVKTFNEGWQLFNYQTVELRPSNGGPYVHHFTREATTREVTREARRSSLAGRENLTERQFILERRERLKAATRYVLRLFANQTLPRPPDPQAKCYLSGADDIRPALFRALPC